MNPVYDFIQKNRVLALIEKAQKSSARNLALDDFDLTQFPEVLITCQGLHILNIGHNRIVEIPMEISQLKNLQHLSLEYNQLDRFPEALKHCPQLISLNLSHNPIKELTCDIGCLVSLEMLWCNSCCLTSIPEEIGNLTKLETFGARHNKIAKLPIRIGELINLRWLTMEDNCLNNVPHNFGKLELIKHINFNKNNFSYIPYRFAKLKNLKYLHLQSNEFFVLPVRTISAMPNTRFNFQNNPVGLEDYKIFTNVILSGTEDEILDMFGHDSDSSSDDWDNSLDSADLNYSATDDDSDNENRDVIGNIPILSKFLVTC
ncbi:uncharacterized protein [Diabrotica undecimpunctata]|uniref:uncharacterized protein n=1 Tax=Diabrotica undecimpunctata TaxID=50387 RepID=UPI003B63B81B